MVTSLGAMLLLFLMSATTEDLLSRPAILLAWTMMSMMVIGVHLAFSDDPELAIRRIEHSRTFDERHQDGLDPSGYSGAADSPVSPVFPSIQRHQSAVGAGAASAWCTVWPCFQVTRYVPVLSRESQLHY